MARSNNQYPRIDTTAQWQHGLAKMNFQRQLQPETSEFQPIQQLDHSRYDIKPSQVDTEAIVYNILTVGGFAVALTMIMTLFSKG
jgi:hypothetical protein